MIDKTKRETLGEPRFVTRSHYLYQGRQASICAVSGKAGRCLSARFARLACIDRGGSSAWLSAFEVIAPDHPGFGRFLCAGLDRQRAGIWAFYLDLLDTLDLQPVRVVASSLGGWIAMEMAILRARASRV